MTGDVVKVEITKTDTYDLIGQVVEILPRPSPANCRGSAGAPAEKLTRISTGAALRVIGQSALEFDS